MDDLASIVLLLVFIILPVNICSLGQPEKPLGQCIGVTQHCTQLHSFCDSKTQMCQCQPDYFNDNGVCRLYLGNKYCQADATTCTTLIPSTFTTRMMACLAGKCQCPLTNYQSSPQTCAPAAFTPYKYFSAFNRHPCFPGSPNPNVQQIAAVLTDQFGDYKCVCAQGYQASNNMGPYRKFCVDINECATNMSRCHDPLTKQLKSGVKQCINTLGGYECICAKGFVHPQSDTIACIPGCPNNVCNGPGINTTVACKYIAKMNDYECNCLPNYYHPLPAHDPVNLKLCYNGVFLDLSSEIVIELPRNSDFSKVIDAPAWIPVAFNPALETGWPSLVVSKHGAVFLVLRNTLEANPVLPFPGAGIPHIERDVAAIFAFFTKLKESPAKNNSRVIYSVITDVTSPVFKAIASDFQNSLPAYYLKPITGSAPANLLKTFSPRWALVVQWHSMMSAYSESNPMETVSFQLVIATDFSNTLAKVTMIDGAMGDWDSLNYPKISNMLVQTGFYGNLMGTSDLTPLKSFSNKAIKSLASTDIGGVSGISGNMYMSLKMSTTASADGVVCSKYLLDNKLSSTDMNDIKTCPCTESEIVMLVFIDNTKYKKNTSKSGYGQCYEVNNFKGWKQMFCCYYRNTILSDPFLLAGKAVSTHNKDVGLPAVFGHCCGQGVVDKKLSSQNLCESFVKQRPPGSCELAAAYDRGFAFGFTHFLTFDGARFNFKEVGDQQLVELRGVFVIQIRVVPNPITGKNGALIKGVAVLDVASNTGVQIILKPDGTFGEDYLDKFLIVKQVPAPFKIFSNQIIQLTVQSKKIWIYVTVKDKVMDVQVLFKRGDFTNLVGLLGNNDNNRHNDGYLTASSTFVVAKCKSVFYYTGTGTYESFLNPNYVPYTLPSNQKTLCSCDKQPVVSWSECYYDFNVKEKVIMFDAAYTHMKNAIGLISPVPKLFGPDVLNISLVSGQTFKSALPYYSSIAKSNITLKTIPTDGAFALDSNDYLTATPVKGTTTEKEIVVEAAAPTQLVALKLSKAKFCLALCVNNGNCYKGEFGDGLFLPIKICDCSSKYKGDLCEIPRNPCQSGPCFPGVICTPLKNGSFSCGECPGGLEGNGIDCYDPNECMKNRTICPQKCINLVRGYECGCNVGFLRAPDHRNCIDVDECANPGKCSTPNTVCVNTIGSYECTCKPGYTKDINNPANCIDVDECLTGQAKCSNMTVCVNKPGTYECMCMNYFETEENTGKCIASKLCDYYGNECQQLCQNVGIGKFRCACYNGFTLNADQKTCSVTQNPSTYKSCNPAELAANCQGGGNVAYCRVLTNNVSVIVCQCKYGYVFDSTKKSCIEIPKCQLTPNLCPSLISTGCQSLPGGQYQCTCKPGFIINANKTFCNDIDECTTAPVTNCLAKRGINTVCINTIGSYVCACKDGFKPDPTNLAGKCIPDHGPGSPCADALIQHKCDPNGVCADNLIAPPFYTCNQCATGFEGNGTYCADKNECNGLLNTCSQNCINTYGSFACACNPGNELSAPGSTTCKDVDECALKSDNCYSDGSCTNKDPYSTSQVIERYQCGCPSSTTLFYGKSSERKGFSCKDNCAASKSCHYDCATVGVGNTDTCLCPDALLKGDGTCSLTPLCIPAACPTKNNVECKNGKCVCLPGFRRYSNNYCIDINECLENNQCTPKEGCKNTVGSYTCTTTCPSGYQYTSQSCTDINECALTGSKAVNCSQSAHCVNLSPGFKCQCNQGYSGSGYYCEDVNECALRTDKCEKDLKRGWCTNTVGSYVCKCQPGYKLSPDKHSCIDINECATNNGGCDYQCINTDGSYRCDCAVGWAPVINAIKTCAPIVTCSSVYTNQCQHKKCARLLSGDTCLCPYGYTASGFKCVDVDECKSAIPPCDTISGRGTCINTIGSFRCACLNGYRIGPDNICSDRDGGWTAWSPYTSCSSSCGNGSRKRQRSCTNPTPAGHGNMCVGNMIEIQPCGKLCYLTNTQKQTMVELHLKGTTSMKMNAMRSQLTTILSQSLNNYCSFSAYTVGYCCNLLGLNTYKPPSTMEFTNASLVTLHPNTPLDIMVNHRPRTVILFSLQSLNPNPLCVLARSSHGVGRRKRQVTGNQLSSQQVAYIFHNRTTQALLTTDIETAIKTSTGKATTALLTTYVNPANSVIVPVVDNTTVTTHLPTRTTPKSSVGGGGGNGGGVGGGGGSTPGSNGINGIPEWVIIVSIVAGVLLLLVILIIALYYIHSKERIEMKKKKEKENEMKNNQSATADDLNW